MKNNQNQSIVKYQNIFSRNGIDVSLLDFSWLHRTLVIKSKVNDMCIWSIKEDDIYEGIDGETICFSVFDTTKSVKDGYMEEAAYKSTDKTYLKKSVELVKKYLVVSK